MKEIKRLEDELETERLSNRRLMQTELLENIVKFVLTNHIGNLRGGIQIDKYEIDKMKDLRLRIDYSHIDNSYIIRINY